jgi:hypothetical protein
MHLTLPEISSIHMSRCQEFFKPHPVLGWLVLDIDLAISCPERIPTRHRLYSTRYTPHATNDFIVHVRSRVRYVRIIIQIKSILKPFFRFVYPCSSLRNPHFGLSICLFSSLLLHLFDQLLARPMRKMGLIELFPKPYCTRSTNIPLIKISFSSLISHHHYAARISSTHRCSLLSNRPIRPEGRLPFDQICNRVAVHSCQPLCLNTYVG